MYLPQQREAEVARRLGGHDRRDPVRTVTPCVLFIGSGNLVARRRLPRGSQAAVVGTPLEEPALAGGHIQELRWIVGVRVLEDRRPVLDTGVTHREPVPDLVALERSACGRVEVPVLLDFVRRPQSCSFQFVCKVIARESAVAEGEERRGGESVSAVARDEVDPDAARR